MLDEGDVHLAQHGDRAACERLLRGLYPVLFGMIMKLLRDRPAAEDAAQESCLRIVKNLSSFRKESSFKSWALAIGYRAAQDVFRKAKPTRGHVALDDTIDVADTSPVGEKPALIRHIWREVNRIGDPWRETAILVWGEGYSQQEAATIMGCSIKTIEWRLADIKKKLAHLIKEEGP